MLASVPAGYIRYTLGAAASELTTGTEIQIINEVQRVFESCHRWSFLGTRSVPLTLRQGEPYIDLPSDFREVLDIQTNPGVINRIVMSTREQIALLRTDTLQSFAGVYRATIDYTPPQVINLLDQTETFASWTASSAVVFADQETSPSSADTSADRIRQSGAATTDHVMQAVAAADLKDGHDYLFSLYVKDESAVTSAISIEQRGASGGVAGTNQPKTVGTLTWTAGVPTIAATTSQGSGIHTVGVETIADGWYRVYVGITWNADPEQASTDIACKIFPETTDTAAQGLYVWGAQLEDIEYHENPLPTRYQNDAASGTASTLEQVPVRRLMIWPVPTTDQLSAFVLNYRRKLPDISSETDVIAVPDYAEPFFNQLARVYARGIHEEDEFDLDARLTPLLQGSMYQNAVAQDSTSQNDYGPLRGSAAESMYSMRDWNNQATIPNPS